MFQTGLSKPYITMERTVLKILNSTFANGHFDLLLYNWNIFCSIFTSLPLNKNTILNLRIANKITYITAFELITH
jgi:hypothetical protein